MFEATIFACIINTGCFIIEDTRGPYKTEDICEQRIAIITNEVNELYYNMEFIDYRCTKTKAGSI